MGRKVLLWPFRRTSKIIRPWRWTNPMIGGLSFSQVPRPRNFSPRRRGFFFFTLFSRRLVMLIDFHFALQFRHHLLAINTPADQFGHPEGGIVIDAEFI